MKVLAILLLISLLFGCYSNQDNNFELCSGMVYPYYFPELKYEGDFYAIKEHFYASYKSVRQSPNNGVVRIRFRVNCNGEAGNYQLESYNFDFQKDSIQEAISSQLMILTQELQAWIPARNDEGEQVNSHKFLAFHIREGELTDIMPK